MNGYVVGGLRNSRDLDQIPKNDALNSFSGLKYWQFNNNGVAVMDKYVCLCI